MDLKIIKLVDYIIDCYKNENFDKNFTFYKIRKEKGNYRIGIYLLDDKKYFFKIIYTSMFNDENKITKMIKPFFKITKKIYSKEFDDKIINLYEYVNTIDNNSFNYLRSDKVSYEDKKEKITTFFDNYIELTRHFLKKDIMSGKKRSDIWFHNRVNQTSRARNYYGDNFRKLLNKIKKLTPEYYDFYNKYFDKLYTYLNKKPDILVSYNHGDFHDFNFSLDNLFWDIDTFGFNPIINDFVIYYWHFYGREDALIYKYSPWLVDDMHNKLNDIELNRIRNLKIEQIKKWYNFIEAEYKNYGIEGNLFSEIIFKLFCRSFLIDNILNYEEEDFIKVIKFFGYFLINEDTDIKELLFNNPILFYGV